MLYKNDLTALLLVLTALATSETQKPAAAHCTN